MPGISHCSMHYSVHCMQSHITATHSKGFPAKVANHLANTAGVMPAVADIPCSMSLHHLHFFDIIRCMWAPNRGGIFQVRSD